MTVPDSLRVAPGTVPTHGALFRFFAPLALLAMSQALTYPLVAMVASRGPGGALNMAGLAQSNTFMFFIGSLSSGLLTAGMTFGTRRRGYFQFARANTLCMAMVGVLHGFFALPGPSHLVFGVVMGLAPSIEEPARVTFLASLPLHLLFFVRNPYHVALFNAHQTGRAYVATLGRIVLTAALSPVFCAFGLVGPVWAVVCLTLPLIMEVVVAAAFARPVVAALPDEGHEGVSLREVLAFSFTLSVGVVFLSLSGYVVGAFVARAPDPERILPATYLALGLVGPVNFGASRVQALVVVFSGNRTTNRGLLRFALVSGLTLGLMPLVFQIPGLREYYYVALQKLPARDLTLSSATAFALVVTPLTVALRAYGEGRAAFLRKPEVVLAGQAAYMGVMTAGAFIALQLGTPGNLIAPVAFLFGNLAATGTIMMALGGLYREGFPAGRPQALPDAPEV